MKLTVFGSTGRTGRHLVTAALAAGHRVTAVARHPEAVDIAHPQLDVVAADVRDPDSFVEAVAGADALCSALGSTAPRRPTTLYSDSAIAMLAAMATTGVRRLIVVTALPVGPAEHKSVVERRFVHPLLHVFFGGGYDDMVRMEHLLAQSDSDWTVVRPPRLTQAAAKGHYRAVVDARLSRAGSLPRADLATAMLDAVNDPALIRHTLNIAT
jgi:putative NADH-flavin reductase